MKHYIYDGTKYVLHEDVVGLSELPTPSAKYLDKVFLLTADQPGYKKGNTYKCVEVTPATDPKTYEWVVTTDNELVYNVLDYGIIRGSTTIDNSLLLQAMIEKVPDGAVIYFPSGVYLFKSSVTITKNLKFKGESELIKPTSWKVAIASTRPESAIRFEPTEANTTLFVLQKKGGDVTRTNSALFYGLTFYAQTRDETTNLVPIHIHSSSKADGIPFDGTLPYPVWTHSERIEGINGLDLSGANNEIGLTRVSNCAFVGFSGFAVKVGQHRYIENCAFYHNNTCIDEAGTDSFVKNCWFCSSHIGILISHEYFPTYGNVQVSSCWCDQMSGHFIYAPNVDASTVAVIMLLIEDAWVDMIDGAAIYVEGSLHHSMISGRFSRCGMKWAGLTIDDRKTKVAKLNPTYTAVVSPSGNPSAQGWYERTGTSPNYVYTLTTDTEVDGSKTYYEKTSIGRKELMPDSDVICARIFHNNFVNISCHKRAVGSQSNNSAGKCPSKVVGVFGSGNTWTDNSDVFHSNVVYSIGDFKTQNMVDGTLQDVPDVIFDDDDWLVARDSIFLSNNKIISRIVRTDFTNILSTANMPTAGADYVDKIVQYAGEETADYKIGHFYVCKAQGTDPETYAWESTDDVVNGMYKVYSGTYDSVEGEFYDVDGTALPKIDRQQYYDIATRATWIYYSAWSGFFRLFNDVVGMEASQMNSTLMREYYPELNTARFRCMNTSGNDGGLIEGFIYKLDRVSVTPEAGDSPVDEGWWEVDSTTGKMIQTEDTTVVSGKLYFNFVWTQVKPQQSVFPGTLDDWNALTEAEKAKYDFVASPDENGYTDSYSTTETKTNKVWIDGKPIYRKCGIYNNGASTGTETVILDSSLTSSYVDTVISTGGCGTTSSNSKLPIGGYNGGPYRTVIYPSTSGLTKANSTDAYTDFKWWIEYTKTTD